MDGALESGQRAAEEILGSDERLVSGGRLQAATRVTHGDINPGDRLKAATSIRYAPGHQFLTVRSNTLEVRP